MNMGESQKSKRITWAPDVNLCQVRLFSSTKPPSEVGAGSQERLLAKASWPVEADEGLPPGFEDMKPANLWQVKLPQIPSMKWRCPPRFEVKSEWQVVSGEESKEVESQNQRERRVLEAIYPRPSAIPPNPRVPAKAEESSGDDGNIPLIRATPIEDEDAGAASSSSRPMIPQPHHLPNSQGIPMLQQQQPHDIVTAVQSALGNDQTNLIDRDLLIRILANPKLLQQLLIAQHHVPNTKLQQPKNSPDSTSINGITSAASFSAQNTRPQLNAPPMTAAAAAAPPQLRTGFVDASSAASPCSVKDMSYYKSLIQQHGGKGGGGVMITPQSCAQSNRMMGVTQEIVTKSRNELKSRIMRRSCIYFNSRRGCKNGANCAYQHDMFSSQKRVGCATEMVGAKRVKLGR